MCRIVINVSAGELFAIPISHLSFYNSCLKDFPRPHLLIALLSIVHTADQVSVGVSLKVSF